MQHRIRAVVACALALFAAAAHASGAWVPGADDAGDSRVEARIVVHPGASKDGRALAGVQLRLDPGWHLYWKNPGDSGIPTDVTWRDAEASALRWPAPATFEEAGGELVTFGYDGEVLLTSWLRPALGAESLGADVSLLVCRASCIPAELALTAPRSPSASERAELTALFAKHESALPVAPASFGVRVSAAASGDGARLVVRGCDADAACRSLAPPEAGPAFFSEIEGEIALHEESAIESDDGLAISLTSDGASLPSRVRGVVALRDADGVLRHLEIDAPLSGAAATPAAAHAVAPAATAVATPELDLAQLLTMLGLALLGGLILNLMPCVLPVLALKVFAVSELAGSSRSEALRHGAAYAAGVLLSMLALAGVVLALRSAGQAVGWGFQFQEPAYVAAISAVLVGFALNLFGVFEIGFQPSALASAGADAPGARRSFFEGLLAVALATPCSAPFLGTALGFAFAGSALTIVAVFLAIGAGLAAPFVLISAFPQLARFLPRSGAWMGALRSALGFTLLASTLWLLWIFGRSAGVDAVVVLLGVLLAGSFVAWLYGRAQHAGTRFAGMGALAAVAMLAIGSANFIGVSARSPASPERADAGPSTAHGEAWSEAALQEALAAGRPVFAYFTADWCLTCKLNERIALDTARTRAVLEARGYTVLRGDWTQRDEAIRRELARHGKAGVPLYLVYSPSSPESPRVLPELLTPDLLAGALAAE